MLESTLRGKILGLNIHYLKERHVKSVVTRKNRKQTYVFFFLLNYEFSNILKEGCPHMYFLSLTMPVYVNNYFLYINSEFFVWFV